MVLDSVSHEELQAVMPPVLTPEPALS
jgi:hypothetical protein